MRTEDMTLISVDDHVIEPTDPSDDRTRLFSFDLYSIRPRQRRAAAALRKKAASHDISIVTRGSRPQKITSFGDLVNAARI